MGFLTFKLSPLLLNRQHNNRCLNVFSSVFHATQANERNSSFRHWFQLQYTRKCYREAKPKIYGYSVLPEIKIFTLSLWWKKRKTYSMLAWGKFRHLMDLFVSCHLFLLSAAHPLSGMNTAQVYRKTQGGLGWVVGISKPCILLHCRLCCSSAYFQFAVVRSRGECFDSWFRMCTPRRFQEGFRQRDKARLFMLLCSLRSVAIIHTPHCA